MRLDRFAKLAVTWSQNQPDKKRDPATGEWRVTGTHCNRFVALCANEVGCNQLGAPDEWTANEIISRIEQLVLKGLAWREVDPAEAQRIANLHQLVVAGAKQEPHGHVCLVIPGEMGWSKKHQSDMPQVANAGADNFYGRLASFAFPPDLPPRFWAWEGPYHPEAETDEERAS